MNASRSISSYLNEILKDKVFFDNISYLLYQYSIEFDIYELNYKSILTNIDQEVADRSGFNEQLFIKSIQKLILNQVSLTGSILSEFNSSLIKIKRQQNKINFNIKGPLRHIHKQCINSKDNQIIFAYNSLKLYFPYFSKKDIIIDEIEEFLKELKFNSKEIFYPDRYINIIYNYFDLKNKQNENNKSNKLLIDYINDILKDKVFLDDIALLAHEYFINFDVKSINYDFLVSIIDSHKIQKQELTEKSLISSIHQNIINQLQYLNKTVLSEFAKKLEKIKKKKKKIEINVSGTFKKIHDFCINSKNIEITSSYDFIKYDFPLFFKSTLKIDDLENHLKEFNIASKGHFYPDRYFNILRHYLKTKKERNRNINANSSIRTVRKK